MIPNILLSNDDGIYSSGIRSLAREMYKRKWNITIIAPLSQRTAEGKAITFDQPVRMQEIPLSYLNGEIGWRTSGTPADAVIYGVYQRIKSKEPPYNLVVSGINAGENTSIHSILTSGTCAVSFEAALLGIPAIAFSINVDEHLFFNDSINPPGMKIAGEIACEIIEKVLKEGFPKGVGFLNVNFPNTLTKNTPIEICKMAINKYSDYIIRREDPRGVPYYWIWGDKINVPHDTDVYAVLEKKVISITPIALNFDASENSSIRQALNFLIKDQCI